MLNIEYDELPCLGEAARGDIGLGRTYLPDTRGSHEHAVPGQLLEQCLDVGGGQLPRAGTAGYQTDQEDRRRAVLELAQHLWAMTSRLA